MEKNNDKSDQQIIFFADKWPIPVGGMETHANAFMEHYKSNIVLTIGFSNEYLEPKYINTNTIIFQKEAIHDPQICIEILKTIHLKKNTILFFNSIFWLEIFNDIRRAFPTVK